MSLPVTPAVMNSTERATLCFDDGYAEDWINDYTGYCIKKHG